MVKGKGKAKRPSSAPHEEGLGCRRSTRIAKEASMERADVLHHQVVSGPPVLPPAPGRPTGKTKVAELSLTSMRVYQETILRYRRDFPWATFSFRSSISRGFVRRYERINGLLGTRECDAWIRYGEEKGFERAFHTQTSESAHRDNGRLSIHSPEIAGAIFSRVRPFVPAEMKGRAVAGCNANVRLYQYAVGQRFGKHVDESVEDENGNSSQWTVLIYLNGRGRERSVEKVETGKTEGKGEGDVLQGGETVFYKGNYGGKVAASFSPLQGACLVHGHGRRCLLHEGAAVTAGVKYLLRTDVMYA